MVVVSAKPNSVPMQVTLTEMNKACRIVARSFHRNAYAEAEKPRGAKL